MFKANKKKKKDDSLETANQKKVKTFVCSSCGKIKETNNIEFGEEIICDCGHIMTEKNE